MVEMLSASRRMVATRSTVGKAENSSGFWIHSATIRMRTESAIEIASPKSIIIAGTGRKNRHRISTMPTAKPMSLPPRLAASLPETGVGGEGTVVTDMSRLASPRASLHAAPRRRVSGEACARWEGRRDRKSGRTRADNARAVGFRTPGEWQAGNIQVRSRERRRCGIEAREFDMPVKSYQTLPTLDQWKRDLSVALAIRNNEPGLKRIDELVMRIGQGTNHVETYGPLLIDLFLSINYWFAERKDRPGRVHEGRLPAMRALFAFVVDQLKPLMATSSDSNPTAMSIGKTIAEMTAVSMDLHGYVADSDFNMRAFSKEQLRQYRLEFNGGLAYQVEWWRPRPLRWSAPAELGAICAQRPAVGQRRKAHPQRCAVHHGSQAGEFT